jgi:hypothetical protein
VLADHQRLMAEHGTLRNDTLRILSLLEPAASCNGKSGGMGFCILGQHLAIARLAATQATPALIRRAMAGGGTAGGMLRSLSVCSSCGRSCGGGGEVSAAQGLRIDDPPSDGRSLSSSIVFTDGGSLATTVAAASVTKKKSVATVLQRARSASPVRKPKGDRHSGEIFGCGGGGVGCMEGGNDLIVIVNGDDATATASLMQQTQSVTPTAATTAASAPSLRRSTSNRRKLSVAAQAGTPTQQGKQADGGSRSPGRAMVAMDGGAQSIQQHGGAVAAVVAGPAPPQDGPAESGQRPPVKRRSSLSAVGASAANSHDGGQRSPVQRVGTAVATTTNDGATGVAADNGVRSQKLFSRQGSASSFGKASKAVLSRSTSPSARGLVATTGRKFLEDPPSDNDGGGGYNHHNGGDRDRCTS